MRAIVVSVLLWTLLAPAGELFQGSPFESVVAASVKAIRAGRGATRGNYVQIVDSGDDALLLRTHLVRNARRSICIQTFIWTNDEVGRFFMYELIQAAKRGVKVQIIADHFVSHKDPGIVAFLATVHPNLQLRHYRPAAGRIRPSRLQVAGSLVFGFRDHNQRMHNKVVIVDDIAAITGGRNIENSYYNRSTEMNFRDRDAFVIGPVVPAMRASFDTFWDYKHSVPSARLIDVVKVIEEGKVPSYSTMADFVLRGRCDIESRDADDSDVIHERFVSRLIKARKVEFIADLPGKNRSLWLRGNGDITRRLASLTKGARTELIIQSPYFVLSASTRKFFTKLRKKTPALSVTVSSNSFGSTDNVMAYAANYKLRSAYIEGLGFDVHEYKPHPEDLRTVFPAFDTYNALGQEGVARGTQNRLPFLCIHAKSLVVDGRISYVGSFNLDPRSEHLNTEVGLLIEDAAVAAQLKATIQGDCRPGNSWVIAKKQMPLGTDKVNALVEGMMMVSPIDLWPVRNTSSFELRVGKPSVPPGHVDFYTNHRDAGEFPGAPDGLSTKEIITRIYKTVGGVTIPIL